MELTYLQITIEPWTYPGTDDKRLKIKLRADGQEFYTEQTLRPNDFESRFEQIMDIATKEIKNAITQPNNTLHGSAQAGATPQD